MSRDDVRRLILINLAAVYLQAMGWQHLLKYSCEKPAADVTCDYVTRASMRHDMRVSFDIIASPQI